MRKKLLVVLSVLVFTVMFAVPKAHADTVDFAPFSAEGESGTWSWAGGSSSLFGDSGNLYIWVSSTYGSSTLNGSVLSWVSGAASPGSGNVVANFGPGGSIDVSQDSSICGASGCFSGTFTGGQILTTGYGYQFSSNFVNGTLDASLLAALGLPTTPTEYNGVFFANLVTGTCPDGGQGLCGTFTSADLSVNPVPSRER